MVVASVVKYRRAARCGLDDVGDEPGDHAVVAVGEVFHAAGEIVGVFLVDSDGHVTVDGRVVPV